MKVRQRRISVWRCTAALTILACSAFYVGLTVAKMMHDMPIEKNSDALVAKWDVAVTSTESGQVDLLAGGATQTYSLKTTNNSEVVSSYAIKVSNIPAGVKVGLDVASEADLQTPVNGEITFTNTGGDLSYEEGQNSRSHVLTLKAASNASATPEGGAAMAVDVLFEQKDPSNA